MALIPKMEETMARTIHGAAGEPTRSFPFFLLAEWILCRFFASTAHTEMRLFSIVANGKLDSSEDFFANGRCWCQPSPLPRTTETYLAHCCWGLRAGAVDREQLLLGLMVTGMHIHIYIYMYMYMCVYIYVYMYIYIYIYIYVYVYMYLCIL